MVLKGQALVKVGTLAVDNRGRTAALEGVLSSLSLLSVFSLSLSLSLSLSPDERTTERDGRPASRQGADSIAV